MIYKPRTKRIIVSFSVRQKASVIRMWMSSASRYQRMIIKSMYAYIAMVVHVQRVGLFTTAYVPLAKR